MYASDPSGYDPVKEFLKVRGSFLEKEEIQGFFIVSLPKLSSAWVALSSMRLSVFRSSQDPEHLPMTSMKGVIEKKRFITTEFSAVMNDGPPIVIGGLYSVDVEKFREIFGKCIDEAIPATGQPLGDLNGGVAETSDPKKADESPSVEEADLMDKVAQVEADRVSELEKSRLRNLAEAAEEERKAAEKLAMEKARQTERSEKQELKAAKIQARKMEREAKLSAIEKREKDLAEERAKEMADEEEYLAPFRKVPINTAWDQLHKRVRNAILENLSKVELPRLIIDADREGSIVGMNDRLLVIKYGYHSGVTGGSRVTSMYYSDITGIEYNSGFVEGVLEILTPSYDGSDNKDFWRGQGLPGEGSDRNSNANDPRTLSNTIPMMKSDYQDAKPLLDELRKLIRSAKAGEPGQGATPVSIADEIAKLGELLNQGLITQDEFESSKRKLL